MLKKILLVVLFAIAGLAVYIEMQPSQYRITRTAEVAAQPAAVFDRVNDFHKWHDWSPWAKLDPQAKVTFEGPPSGKGAIFKWAGNDDIGEGKMTLVESAPTERVRIKVDFVKPYEGSSESRFSFKPNGQRTEVSWTIMGTNDSFIAKAICLIMNPEKMLGGEMEKGLTQLKALAEKG